jgi:Ca2+-binding RTX toxin-like protein
VIRAAVTVSDPGGDTITVGNGADDVLNLTFSINNNITLGNGNGDVVNDSGSGNTITVGNGNDTVFGGTNDFITTGNGNNQLVAAPGDTWTVGHGQDTFAFNPGFGNNTITDFNTSHDVLQFNAALFANYAAAMADTKQVGANTVITYDSNDTVTLTGVTASHLTANNFKFS